MKLPPALRDEMRKRAVDDFMWFSRHVLGYKFFDAPIHDRMGNFVSGMFKADERFSVLLAPRGHGKSKLITVGHTLWTVCRDRNIKWMILHGSAGLSQGLMSEIKQHLESNQLLRALFPDVCWNKPKVQSPLWTSDEIIVKRDIIDHTPTISASSMASAKTGRHVDGIILDDLVNAENTTTPDQIEKVKAFIQTLPPLLMGPQSRILDVGTRWHFEDAHGSLINNENEFAGQVRSHIEGCFDEDGNPQWPSKMDAKHLERERKAMGEYLFSANYLNNPSPEGTMLFREDRIKRWTPDFDESGRVKVPDNRPVWMWTAVDPNAGMGNQHDPAVVMTVARDAEGNHFVIDVYSGHPDVQQLINEIRRQVQAHKPMQVLVETVAYQRQLVHWMRRDAVENGVSFAIRELGMAERSSQSKFMRIRSLDPMVNGGKLYVPYGTSFDKLVREISMYSSAARHDDHLDCLADIWQYGNNPPKAKVETRGPSNPNTIESWHRRMGGYTNVGAKKIERGFVRYR